MKSHRNYTPQEVAEIFQQGYTLGVSVGMSQCSSADMNHKRHDARNLLDDLIPQYRRVVPQNVQEHLSEHIEKLEQTSRKIAESRS